MKLTAALTPALAACLCLAPAACAPAAPSAPAPRVLIVGGGTSHDYDRWFDEAAAATLGAAGARVRYTAAPAEVLPALSDTDVLYLANNQPLTDPALREGIFEAVAGGKGLLIGHAAAWYNWKDWPEYNRRLVGGGATAHRRYGEFQVDIVAPDHPVVQGVPSSFTITDELYRFNPDPDGSPITVLATAREVETGTVYPILWTVAHPGGRIVANTLGHDGEAHTHPAYQRILQNSLRWVAGAGR